MAIRMTLDFEVPKGEEGKLERLLRDREVCKKVAQYLANSVLPNKDQARQFEVEPVGGHAHYHEASDNYSCPFCIDLAGQQTYRAF